MGATALNIYLEEVTPRYLTKSLDRFLRGIPSSLKGGFHVTISKLGTVEEFYIRFWEKKTHIHLRKQNTYNLKAHGNYDV